ncbi:hypothetical protein [Sphingomonas sp. T9W2]|uniref:hypothetical protein n=1 Tax=Sphingomonas sp. T9W2 TaxID=3143183 RepID=UPI0031F49D94
MNAITSHPRAAFEAAHKAYTDAFAYFEALPVGDDRENAALDRWIAAMDHLIENVPAPDGEALAVKIELAATRDIPMYDEWIAAFAADARRMTMKDR